MQVWFTRTLTLVYPSTFMSRHKALNQMISSSNSGLQRFNFTPPQRLSQGICYWGEELSNVSCTYRTKLVVRCKAGVVPLMKQGDRFLSSLSSPALAGDPSATHRHIKKFVAASPKSVTLNVLSHLLSDQTSYPHLSFFALSVSLCFLPVSLIKILLEVNDFILVVVFFSSCIRKLPKHRGLIGILNSLLSLLLCSINKRDLMNQKLYFLQRFRG